MLDFPKFEKYLGAFDFVRLFVDVLGWNRARADAAWSHDKAGDTPFNRRTVAELGGVVAIQVVTDTPWPNEQQRFAVWKHIARSHAENLLIFTDSQDQPRMSQWYWVKRDKHPESGKPRTSPRRHEYFKGQPVDLFAGKLRAMVVDLSELDASGRLPVLEAARRLEAALDVQTTTKKFFTAYEQRHEDLLGHIQGIDDPRDKRWYASVLLNRLMFIWFLQKKGFLCDTTGSPRTDYLRDALSASVQRGPGRFYSEFLDALFFEAFAKPDADRTAAVRQLTGRIPYLNGGLFLPHKLELDAAKNRRLGVSLHVADAAFQGIFELFASYSWHLDDTPGGKADEINPDVLGYIFEKYINQKAFGAYYTRPEITGYLADRAIHTLILERVREPAVPELGIKEVRFDSVADLLAHMDATTALKLVTHVLPGISILDPAAGSGAFLVAALKSLMNVYYAVVGRAELGASAELQQWLRGIQKDHPSVGYYIKRRIVTDNLYGVDIMEEASEIAKLRLFLSMVASVRRVEDLEPLPNIDFNILSGNSLVGLTRVDEVEFNQKNTQRSLFAQVKTRPFAELLATKNRLLGTYRHWADKMGKDYNLRALRDEIDTEMHAASDVMNELLRDQFEKLGVKFEQATWDKARKKLGKPAKRPIERSDIDAQTPFHWGYVFDEIMHQRGGFDIVLANPPWEVLKPQAKEFFAEYSGLVSKNKMTIKAFEKEQASLLQDPEIRQAWLDYESRFPHLSQWFRAAPEYANQSAMVGGKKTGSDINLYKLFVERSFHLLRPGGHCGIVIPSGIYTDLGAKGLRDLLFGHTQIEGLFCFENRKIIFEGVDSRFKFVVLTFQKATTPRLLDKGERNASAPPNDLLTDQAVEAQGGITGTTRFPAAFMRHDVQELQRFPQEGALWLEVELIERLSPDSHSVMEFKTALDVQIAEKMLRFPLLGERIEGAWNAKMMREFDHTSSDVRDFVFGSPVKDSIPLLEGKMIWQFDATYAEPQYWLTKAKADEWLKKKKADTLGRPYADTYRVAFRRQSASTNERTLVATVIPKRLHDDNLATFMPREDSGKNLSNEAERVYLCALLNSFCIDYCIRARVTTNLNFFFLEQLPIPRLSKLDDLFTPIVIRAAHLICTTPEFDALAQAVGLPAKTVAGRSEYGATDPTERAQLRAELDGLVAHLYGLSEAEFVHILGTFPLVPQPVTVAAHNAYRDVERGLVK